MTAQSTSWNPLSISQFAPLVESQCRQIFSTSNPPSFKCTMQLWWSLLVYLTSSMTSPTNAKTPLETGNLSSRRIFYNGRASQWILPLLYSDESNWNGTQYTRQRPLVPFI